MDVAFQVCVSLRPTSFAVRSSSRTSSVYRPTVRRARCRNVNISCCVASSSASDDATKEAEKLPKPGQIVLTPGKWADEDGVGLVEGVRYVESRGTYVVDVVQLRRAGNDIFEVVSRGRGKKSPYNWYDVSAVQLVPTAEYLWTRQAYRVDGVRDGYSVVEPMDEQAKLEADRQYRELKSYMLSTTGITGVLGTLATGFAVDFYHGQAFGLGAVASLAYLALLQGSVDMVGEEDSWAKKLYGLRFFMPVLPFVYFSRFITAAGSSTIPASQVGAMTLGLLSYKMPVLIKTGKEAVDSFAEIEPGTSGMLGTVVSLTARSIKGKSNSDSNSESEPATERANASMPPVPVLVFAGPSGAGKGTLIKRLEEDYGGKYMDFSISHTTRLPREGEKDGVDYYFVDKAEFEAMTARNEFIEYARVHDNYYGTSFSAVEAVSTSGKVCILDIDIQGIEAFRKNQTAGNTWAPRFIWVAPPSFETLEERLRGRGSEDEETLKTRLNTAKKEIAYAATNNVFDLTIINDELERSYAELKGFFQQILKEFQDAVQ